MLSGSLALAVALVLALALAVASSLGGCDPVHRDAVDALGGEAPDVRKGPLHRPGQPCTTCHDGALGDPPEFTVAGTIYQNEGDTTPAVGATVSFTSVDGKTYDATTNEAGNFYATPSQFMPGYPMKVSVALGQDSVKMVTAIGRNGSCATCHFDPAGPTSAGHVFIPAKGVALP
jgi:hypothetical protein